MERSFRVVVVMSFFKFLFLWGCVTFNLRSLSFLTVIGSFAKTFKSCLHSIHSRLYTCACFSSSSHKAENRSLVTTRLSVPLYKPGSERGKNCVLVCVDGKKKHIHILTQWESQVCVCVWEKEWCVVLRPACHSKTLIFWLVHSLLLQLQDVLL